MKIRIFLAFACIAALVGCGSHSSPQGPESGRNAPSIAGRLLLSDGKSPAPNALVTLQPADAIAPITGAVAKRASRHVVLTAADGAFSIDSCGAGVYVIEGVGGDGKAVRIDSIVVGDTWETTEVPPQSLQVTGAIRGRVVLDGGGDPSNVFVLAFGSDRFAQAQSDGKFFMGDLPYGKYDLKIVCVLAEYGECKTMPISVSPGDTVSLDTIAFEAQALCVPKNVTLRYDTMIQRVVLRWDSCKSPNVRGYNVYRFDTAFSYKYSDAPLNKERITETCAYSDDSLLINHTYVYGVAAVSKDGTIGGKSAPLSVTTAFIYHIDTLDEPEGVEFDDVSISICWNTGDRLTVVAKGDSSASIIDYGDDFSIVRHSDLSIPFSCWRNLIVDGENIYLKNCENSLNDSCIYSFTRSGTMKHAYNARASFRQYSVWNDTVVVLTDSGMALVFDTTGRLLSNVKTDIPCGFIPDGKFSTDGNFLTQRIIVSPEIYFDDRPRDCIWELRKYDLKASHAVMFAAGKGSGGYFDARDACGDLYIYWLEGQKVSSGFVVAEFSGGIIARFPFPQMNTNDEPAINSRGQIAYITNKYSSLVYHSAIIVLTPP